MLKEFINNCNLTSGEVILKMQICVKSETKSHFTETKRTGH